MNVVDPIRDVDKIREIKENLRATNSRDFLLFTMGINLALRASDLLSLKVKDVFDEASNVRRYIWVREKKTGKQKKLFLNSVVEDALLYHFRGRKLLWEQFLFTARRSGEQLDRQALWELVRKWTKNVGLTGHYGTHSLRKTWGYIARVIHHKDLPQIMEKLGHSNQEMTKRYIGITQEEINELEREVCI